MRAMACVASSPTCVHVFPPSVVFQTPLPCMMLPRSSVSPIPTYTTSGLASQTATAPTDELVSARSVIGRQVVPPSVVFQRPPPVAPNQYSSGRFWLPATACERPPRLGPMLRQRSAASATESGLARAAGPCVGAAAAVSRCAAAGAARASAASARVAATGRLRREGAVRTVQPPEGAGTRAGG